MAICEYFKALFLNTGDGTISRNDKELILKNNFLKNNVKIFSGTITQGMKRKIKLKAYLL